MKRLKLETDLLNVSKPYGIMPGDRVRNINKSCVHYKSTGDVVSIDDKGNINFTRNQRDGRRFIFAAINIQKNIADNNWHFVTLTYNGSEISLSIDENSRSQQSNIILKKKNLIQYPGSCSFESDYSDKFQLQSGNIDDFIIYNRALTNDEINYLFHYKNSYKE